MDFDLIKSKASGDQNIKENDRFYIRFVQNFQIGFDEIKEFPIFRFYEKFTTIKQILAKIIEEFNLFTLGDLVLSEKNDVYYKDIFSPDEAISQIKSIKNGDTILLSRKND